MTINDIRLISEALLQLGFGSIIAAFITFLLLKSFVPGYLTEKGRNVATKEDISEITEKIEEVKRQHAELLEKIKTKNLLRIAALDRRLQAHQEAYELWREINGAIDKPPIYEVVKRCDKWWGANCLYLEPAARSAFLLAYVGARDLDFYKSSTDAAYLVSKTLHEIQAAGGVIQESVALPKLNELELGHSDSQASHAK